MRLNIEERKLIAKIIRNGATINFAANLFKVNRKTASYWANQDLRTVKDLPRNTNCKITVDVEIAILYMRLTFKWGTARIQQGLMNLPDFMLENMEIVIQNFKLSRTSINNILKKHNLNGYRGKKKEWKFFRAKRPNELWQLDPKGYFKVRGKRYWIVAVIDDFSRKIIQLQLFESAPNCKKIMEKLEPLIEKFKPKKILTDNNPFKEDWRKMCLERKG